MGIEPISMDSISMDSISMESAAMASMSMEFAATDPAAMEPAREDPAGSSVASSSAGSPSRQISIRNGRPLAGMNPGGMSIRNATATSSRPVMNVRLRRLRELKRISFGFFSARKSYQQSEAA